MASSPVFVVTVPNGSAETAKRMRALLSATCTDVSVQHVRGSYELRYTKPACRACLRSESTVLRKALKRAAWEGLPRQFRIVSVDAIQAAEQGKEEYEAEAPEPALDGEALSLRRERVEVEELEVQCAAQRLKLDKEVFELEQAKQREHLELQRGQLELQLELQRGQLELQRGVQELQERALKLQLELQERALKLQLELQRGQLELQLELQRGQLELQRGVQELQERALQLQREELDLELRRRQLGA